MSNKKESPEKKEASTPERFDPRIAREVGVPGGPGKTGHGNQHAETQRARSREWAERELSRELAEIERGMRAAKELHDRVAENGYRPELSGGYSDRRFDRASTADRDIAMGDPAITPKKLPDEAKVDKEFDKPKK